LETKLSPDLNEIKSSYYDNGILEDTLSKITIYNIRPTSNSVKQQDVYEIANSSQGVLGEYVQKEIEALEADYIIVSGKAGLFAFERIMRIQENIQKDKPTRINNSVILAVKHFSRPSYKTWIKNIEDLLAPH
jgi:hypothetical protein